MFEKIVIEFKGQQYTVPANRVFGLVAEIEEHIRITDLHNGPKNTAVAKAYAAAINYAGGDADIGEVYEMLFDRDGGLNIRTAITNLMMMMLPPSALIDKDAEAKPEAESKKKPAPRRG
jgi:hypothetical protein